jgi:hypothetical protein
MFCRCHVCLSVCLLQLRAKKDQQADFLKKKLEMRRRAREKELVDGGMAPAEARAVSGAEAAADEAVQLRALEQAFVADLGAKQAALDEQTRAALGALKERHEGTLASLETGLAAQKEKKRKALEVRGRCILPPLCGHTASSIILLTVPVCVRLRVCVPGEAEEAQGGQGGGRGGGGHGRGGGGAGRGGGPGAEGAGA